SHGRVFDRPAPRLTPCYHTGRRRDYGHDRRSTRFCGVCSRHLVFISPVHARQYGRRKDRGAVARRLQTRLIAPQERSLIRLTTIQQDSGICRLAALESTFAKGCPVARSRAGVVTRYYPLLDRSESRGLGFSMLQNLVPVSTRETGCPARSI